MHQFLSVLAIVAVLTRGAAAWHYSTDTEYIVEFSTTTADVRTFCEGRTAEGRPCIEQYSLVLLGCAVELTDSELDTLRGDPRIKGIHANSHVQPQAASGLTVQQAAPWNLARLDHPALQGPTSYSYSSDGTGVNVYVLDTGVLSNHDQFWYSHADRARGLKGTRVAKGFSAFGDGNTEDCFGHGTHVAGIVGGLTYGVAKNVTIVPVRCVDCNGNGAVAQFIAGLEWVAGNFQVPAVASMSLGSNAVNEALDSALQAVIALGVTGVVAAGNYGSNACLLSPARVPQGITVAATDETDTRWASSNFGACVDLYAPGVDILSAMFTSPSATIVASGTSMACPAVSGVAAQYLQRNPAALPAEVQAFMRGNAAPGVVVASLNERGTPNLLLQADLTVLPTVGISPSQLAPVVLFENSFQTSATQTVSFINVGNRTVAFNTSATPNGLFGGWIYANPPQGTIAPNGVSNVSLQYDASQINFQGIYTADVLLTTDAQPIAKAFVSTVYVFCEALQQVAINGAHTVQALTFTLAQDTRPPAPAWPPGVVSPDSTYIYFQVAIRFSHPVAHVPNSAVLINAGAGIIESLVSISDRGALCSDFLLKAKVPFSRWETAKTTVCVTVEGAGVTDIYGIPFGAATKNCTTVDHRPRGALLSVLMATRGGAGLITNEQLVPLVMAFTEPVTGLTAASFTVTGPTSGASVTALQLVRSTASYYQLAVNLPATYFGNVVVSLKGTVLDSSRQSNLAVDGISFQRVRYSLLKGTSFKVLLPPVLANLP